MVHLDADAVGVFEQHRVVAGCELRPFLGRVDDLRVELGAHEVVDRVDVGALARAEAEVMEAGAVLIEPAIAFVGRRAAHEDPGAAADLFRSALALFRGAPLADLALLDFVQPEVRRLEELRLSALMDRIDADLALGRGAELVPELEGLVQSNPFQERLRGQLMLALYRSGRQTDALEVYRGTRELLADELGLEPSRALQQLERSMLQHDPELDLPELAV